MKRTILLLLLVSVLVINSFTQDKKYTKKYPGTVKYDKTEQPATVIEFAYPSSEVEEGLAEYFKKQGAKPKESKGFYFVSNVKLPEDPSKVFDIYYKVEKDGKSASKVYAILTTPGEDLVHRTSNHTELAAVAGAGIITAAEVGLSDHDFNRQMAVEEAEIRKTEKKLTSLADESKSLEKKRASVEKEIEANKQDQLKLQEQLDAKKQKYQQMVEEKAKKN